MDEIKAIFDDLKDLLNEHATNRTLDEDLADISNDLESIKARVYSDNNYDMFEEDNIALGWALDLIDYLYKIYKVVEKGE